MEREAPTEWTWRQRRAVAGQWASVVLLGVAAFGLLVMVVGAMGALDFYPRLLRKIGAVCLSMIGLFVWAFSLRFLGDGRDTHSEHPWWTGPLPLLGHVAVLYAFMAAYRLWSGE
ncbi:MAG TPA: hypothetical protein DCP69_00460 [Candidatus Omnitrophica bacterium]|nr:hypothetical protein [Candidatus Omnitrophota bacterium]